MTTDKELLELAAKAIGMKLRYNMLGGLDARQNWNPLEDDGDAFRLAVSLNINIITDNYGTMCITKTHRSFAESHDINDEYSAARRAIVRTAAYIGSD